MNQLLVSEDITINKLTHQVTQNEVLLNLPDLSYKTLVTLIQMAPNTVTIDQMIDRVWEGIEVSPETVTQRIALLRKSLNANSDSKIEYISSVRNKGYRWIPEVKSINQPLKNNYQFKWWMILMAAVMLIISVYFYVFKQSTTEITPTPVEQNKDEFLSQAWLYLNKHDLPSNKIALELFRKSLATNLDNVEAMIGIAFALSH